MEFRTGCDILRQLQHGGRKIEACHPPTRRQKVPGIFPGPTSDFEHCAWHVSIKPLLKDSLVQVAGRVFIRVVGRSPTLVGALNRRGNFPASVGVDNQGPQTPLAKGGTHPVPRPPP